MINSIYEKVDEKMRDLTMCLLEAYGYESYERYLRIKMEDYCYKGQDQRIDALNSAFCNLERLRLDIENIKKSLAEEP